MLSRYDYRYTYIILTKSHHITGILVIVHSKNPFMMKGNKINAWVAYCR